MENQEYDANTLDWRSSLAGPANRRKRGKEENVGSAHQMVGMRETAIGGDFDRGGLRSNECQT